MTRNTVKCCMDVFKAFVRKFNTQSILHKTDSFILKTSTVAAGRGTVGHMPQRAGRGGSAKRGVISFCDMKHTNFL